jgi:hypothetical protein
MSTGEPEAKRDETRPRERRRLKLIESYGAFSDDRLQEVAQKIRGITSDNDIQPTALQGNAPPSSGEVTESITQWITQCPLEELAALLRLKERERELQFALFVAQLSEEEMARLDQEAQAQVKPNIGLSPEFQMERYKDGLLRQWFAQRQPPQQEH